MRLNIKLSPFIARKLAIWGALHGRSKGVYASQIISSRVEANLGLINEMLAEEARHLGISVEELEAQLLNEQAKEE